MTRLVVLGAGPAGLGAALDAAERGFEVHVLERGAQVGGNTGSFEIAGIRVDYGSHRLHPATDEAILSRLKQLLGDELLVRPRHGRIRLGGRWIRFPLRALDLLFKLPPAFGIGAGLDTLRGVAGREPKGPETFTSVLEAKLGPTITQGFYAPYARKIWGLEPDRIAAQQAHRRISANSIGKLLRKLVPGKGGSSGKRSFYYPRQGFGRICERLAEAAVAAGAEITLGATATGLEQSGDSIRVSAETSASRMVERADHVASTIPLTNLARLIEPAAPPEVSQACDALRFRAMLLVYVVLDRGRFSPFDAHYFPTPEIAFTRISEPKNYGARKEPENRTVLCGELPCEVGDKFWKSSDQDLGELLREGMERVDLPLHSEILEVHTRRLSHAYPIYDRDYEQNFELIDRWISEVPRLTSFGRQGLFAHDNTHHALAMAQAAVRCLSDDGEFDERMWQRAREVFATHVVED